MPGGRPRTGEIALSKRRGDKVVYAGSLSYREHVDLFVRSVPFVRAKKGSVKFFSAGGGDNANSIKALDCELQTGIRFFWFPEEEKLFRFLASCSVAVLPSGNDMTRRMGIPIKLLDYLSVSLPVVARYQSYV